MTYWRATVERPEGGGWIEVGVFGTPDTPGEGSARYLSADAPRDAARLLLSHVWPTNLAEYNKRKDGDKWRDAIRANTGIADHRITIDVCEAYRWSLNGKPAPEPQVFTVAELRLADVRTEVQNLADARAKLEELTAQVRQLRGDVRHQEWRVEQAREEAVRAGVEEPEVAKASRLPRQPRKPRNR